jgi:hypothetical protein
LKLFGRFARIAVAAPLLRLKAGARRNEVYAFRVQAKLASKAD